MNHATQHLERDERVVGRRGPVVFDFPRALRAAGFDVVVLEEVVADFLRETPPLMERVSEATRRRDRYEIRRQVGQLAGAAAILAFDRLRMAAGTLESAANREGHIDLESAKTALDVAYEEVRDEVAHADWDARIHEYMDRLEQRFDTFLEQLERTRIHFPA